MLTDWWRCGPLKMTQAALKLMPQGFRNRGVKVGGKLLETAHRIPRLQCHLRSEKVNIGISGQDPGNFEKTDNMIDPADNIAGFRMDDGLTGG